ncbi:hypothetical protein MML48_5g00015898 [Holotrichia oblita]|uniref:Uncharacterized protein n=1 Tax=Holotrichia oblita TaxID=644536 RepID=A0ACB9T660_HOLOL|nr:hypothetical protein MML48_5g00015898 [Holotrichia oblita]
MKSKVKSSGLHGHNVDALKNSSFNFLENERYHTVVERGHVDENLPKFSNGEVQEDSQTSEELQEVSKMPENLTPENSEQIVTSEERVTQGRYAPKRYVTTCYFQPKQLPVWYSETMILNIGSTKKKYFESIYYENKLSPFHWTESMTTIIPDSEEPIRVNSTVDIPISQPEFYYISLEPQQTAAMAK